MEHKKHYLRFAVMIAISFVAMYILMYAMVDRFANVFHSFNQAYMAGLMAAVMIPIELIIMGSMYPNKKLNAILVVVGIVLLGGFWVMIRQQALTADRQFLKSMIPHHAGAILMCGEAQLSDPEIVKLCGEITESQEREIAQMKAILQRLDQQH